MKLSEHQLRVLIKEAIEIIQLDDIDDEGRELGHDDLTNHLSVRETHAESVSRRVVLVLGLNHQTLARVVVRLSLATTTKLRLKSLEVRLVLDNLDKRLLLYVDQKKKVWGEEGALLAGSVGVHTLCMCLCACHGQETHAN